MDVSAISIKQAREWFGAAEEQLSPQKQVMPKNSLRKLGYRPAQVFEQCQGWNICPCPGNREPCPAAKAQRYPSRLENRFGIDRRHVCADENTYRIASTR